jgi:hypothetical protein
MSKSRPGKVHLHLLLDEELMDRFKSYFPGFGAQSRVVRALIERQLKFLDDRTAEALRAKSPDIQLPDLGPLESDLVAPQ